MITDEAVDAFNSRLTVNLNNIKTMKPSQLDQVKTLGSNAEALLKNKDLAMYVHQFKFELADALAGITGHADEDNNRRIAYSNQLAGIEGFIQSLGACGDLREEGGLCLPELDGLGLVELPRFERHGPCHRAGQSFVRLPAFLHFSVFVVERFEKVLILHLERICLRAAKNDPVLRLHPVRLLPHVEECVAEILHPVDETFEEAEVQEGMEECGRDAVPHIELRFRMGDELVDGCPASFDAGVERNVSEVLRIDGLAEEVLVDDVGEELAVVRIFERQALLARSAEVPGGHPVERERGGVVRRFPDEGVQSVLHELLDPEFKLARNPLLCLAFDRLTGVIVPEFKVGGRHTLVLMRHAVHDDRPAVPNDILERIHKIRLVGQTEADPRAGIDEEGNDPDHEGDVAAGQHVGDLTQPARIIKERHVFDANHRAMRRLMLLVKDVMKIVGEEQVVIARGRKRERRGGEVRERAGLERIRGFTPRRRGNGRSQHARRARVRHTNEVESRLPLS